MVLAEQPKPQQRTRPGDRPSCQWNGLNERNEAAAALTIPVTRSYVSNVTIVMAVDLAAKYSAVCFMDHNYKVLSQFDSLDKSEDLFVDELAWSFEATNSALWPEVMVIEDLPHKLPYSTLIKRVCRLQGRIIQRIGEHAGAALFLAPAEWRRTYDGMGRGTGPTVVFPVAASFGYRPPDLTSRARGIGGNTVANKVASDYCAAYLIARWAVDTKRQHGTYDVPGTSRYDTKVIKKKDFADAENS